MTITFCGHSQINGQNKLSNWLDMILPALIEGGAAKTLNFARSKGKVIFQYPRQAEKQ